MTLNEVLALLPDAKQTGDGYKARCPAHDDKTPSLSITQGDRGVVLHCFAGCSPEAVCSALGITTRDLFTEPDNGGHKPPKRTPRPRTPQRHDATDDAAAAAEKDEPSRIVGTYDYTDADGELLYQVVRYEPKDFRQRRPDGNGGWVWNLDSVQRVVFRLPELIAADPVVVFVVEGEKDVHTAESLGFSSTCAAGGAWKEVDDSILDNRHIVIIADADTPGRKKAQAIAGRLHGRAASVCVFEMPDGHKDLTAWVEGMDARTPEELASALMHMADAAPAWTPKEETTEALVKNTEPQARAWIPYPAHRLPEPLASYTMQVADSIGVDPCFAAMPLIAMAGACIGTTRCIMPRHGWLEPAMIWAGIVAESGAKKTPVFRAVLRPLRDIDSQRIAEGQAATEQYEAAKANHKDDPEGEHPQPPRLVRHVVSDVTPEGLARMLEHNPRGVLLDRDELSGWLAGFDRYSKGAGGAEASFWLSAWSGERAVVDRASRATQHIARAAVSIAGQIQPGVLRHCIGTEHRDNGLLPRFLLAAPPRQPAFWTDTEIEDELQRRIKQMVEHLLSLVHADSGAPVVVKLGPDARDAFRSWHDTNAIETVAETCTMAAFTSKMPAHVLRLALIFHEAVAADASNGYSDGGLSDGVSVETIERAIELATWHAEQMRRVVDLFGEDEPTEAERLQSEEMALVRWVEGRGGHVEVRDVTSHLRRYRGKTEEAKKQLDRLVMLGYGVWKEVDDRTCFRLGRET